MTEHKRNIFVRDCMDGNAWYNQVQGPGRERVYSLLAEVYLMRAESLTNYNTEK